MSRRFRARLDLLSASQLFGRMPGANHRHNRQDWKQPTRPGWAIQQNEIEMVPAIVPDVLRSPSQPLDPATRATMEARFGHDFSRVRIHTDARAAEAADALSARAFTSGRDIFLGKGQFAPETSAGQRLLGHELAHVVQQSHVGAAPFAQCQLKEPPTRFITSERDEVEPPSDSEKRLDERIASRRVQDLLDEKGKPSGKVIGTVDYKNLPQPTKDPQASQEAELLRRAAKHALLEVITSDTANKGRTEWRVRVPLQASLMPSDYAMIVLRFDKARNVEVEFAGKDVQASRSKAPAAPILASLTSTYGVTFATNPITAKLLGSKRAVTFPGKAWSPEDAELLQQALALLGTVEWAILRGGKFRRLGVATAGGAPAFHSTGDNSINLADAALPFDKAIWFGEGGKFYTRGVHVLLHEIGHALTHAKAPPGSRKGTSTRMDQFKAAVKAESAKRKRKTPGTKFAGPGIMAPTEYAGKSWNEFYADTYAIYRTNPSFLKTLEFQYLYGFFAAQFP